jgi:hypothetical protein
MLVIVSYEPLTGESLDLYLDAEVAKLPAEIRVAERRKVTLNATEVVRFVFEMRYNTVDVNDLTYVFWMGERSGTWNTSRRSTNSSKCCPFLRKARRPFESCAN